MNNVSAATGQFQMKHGTREQQFHYMNNHGRLRLNAGASQEVVTEFYNEMASGMKQGSCEYGGFDTISHCAGSGGGGMCSDLIREAFERLKTNSPINVPKGTKVSQNNVAKEASKHPTALKKDRFPLLVLEIQDYLKQQDVDSEVIARKKELRKKRTLEERFQACKKERDQLASICEAQLNVIERLQDEMADYKRGVFKPSPIR